MTRLLVTAVAVACLAVMGCETSEFLDDLGQDVATLDGRLDGLDTRLGGIERSLAAVDSTLKGLADEAESSDVVVLDQRLADLDARLDGIERRLDETASTSAGKNIPTWVPGTTKMEAEDALNRCLGSRLSTFMGPFGAALAPDFVDSMDLDGMFESMPEDVASMVGGDKNVIPIWFVGSLMGCWAGQLQ